MKISRKHFNHKKCFNINGGACFGRSAGWHNGRAHPPHDVDNVTVRMTPRII